MGIAAYTSLYALICPRMPLYVLVCPYMSLISGGLCIGDSSGDCHTISNMGSQVPGVCVCPYMCPCMCPYMSLYVLICPYMSTISNMGSQVPGVCVCVCVCVCMCMCVCVFVCVPVPKAIFERVLISPITAVLDMAERTMMRINARIKDCHAYLHCIQELKNKK